MQRVKQETKGQENRRIVFYKRNYRKAMELMSLGVLYTEMTRVNVMKRSYGMRRKSHSHRCDRISKAYIWKTNLNRAVYSVVIRCYLITSYYM